MNPTGVLQLAGLVQVQNQVAREHVARIVAHHHRSPGRLARRLHGPLQSGGIGGEMAHEGQWCWQRIGRRLRVRRIGIAAAAEFCGEGLRLGINQLQVHRGIVQAGSLVDVDIQPVGGFHLQRRLHARRREHRHRRVAPVHGLLHPPPDFRELRLLCLLLLSVVVAGQPPCRMIAGHGKLCQLLLDQEIVQFLLLRELIAQSDAVVIDAEADDDRAVALIECPSALARICSHLVVFMLLVQDHRQFIVVVAYGGRLSPDGFPSLVESRDLVVLNGKALHEVRLVHSRRGMLVLGQFQSQVRRFHHSLPLVGHFIRRPSIVGNRERQHHIAVWRLHSLRRSHHGQRQQQNKQDFRFHILQFLIISISHFLHFS